MAIEIIQRGIPPEDQPIQATCRHCASVLQFLPADATRHSDQRDGDYYEIQCPVCRRYATKSVRQ